MALSKIVSTSLANGAVSVASITDNTVTSAKLTSTGVVANSYGNTTAIPVITVDAQGRITNATTSSVSGVTGLSYTAANSTVTVSTSTTNFNAVVTAGNSTVQGLLTVIDSVSNTSTAIAVSANSVTTAYQLAANAVSNATAYAATAYSNAVATAASDATTKAGTAYSNATSYADTAAGTAYSNAVSVASSDATTKAGTAYSNAISYANTVAYTAAGTAYTNAVATAASDATTKAGTAYSNATSYADTKAGTAYTNATAYADTKAATAYSNATSYADTKAATAYSNVFNGGTFSGAVTVQANLTANSVRVNGNMQIDGDLTVSGNTVTINVTNLNVEDNMIYLNSNSTVSHPDLGFAGNYNDGSYKHAGLFRDATDGVWKFFHGYTPEPDASAFIDTANTSFALSNLQINYVIGNVTGSANSATYLGGNTASTLRSYSDTVAGTAYSNATTYAATIAGTAYSNAVSVAASDATTKAGTAYSNATTYAATIAGTAYSNAVSVASSDATTKAGTAYSNAVAFAANASNISSGTLSASRLPATYLTSVTGTAPVVSSGGSTPAISMAAANSTVAGYMTTTYASKLDGIATGATNVTNNNQLTNGAGYITSYTETSTLANVTGRGATTSTALTLSGNVNMSGSGLFLNRNASTTHGLSWYSSAYTAWCTYMAQVAQTSVGPTGNITAPSGTHVTSWALRNFVENVTGYGWTWESGTSTGQPSVVAELRASDGLFQANGSLRSPIFYDSNDTGYYVDPNSTGVSLRIAGVIQGNHVNWTGEHNKIQWHSNHMYFQNMNDGIWIFRNSNGAEPILLYASGYGYATGSWRAPNWYYSDNTAYGFLGSNVYADTINSGAVGDQLELCYYRGSFTSSSGSMRAPLFYDRDDTGYYVDPNGGSQLQGHTRFGPYAGHISSGNVTGVEIMNNGGTGDANVAAISFHCSGTYGLHLYLRHDGYFGMGGWSATTWRWYVLNTTGDMTAAGNVTAYSDPRLKEDVKVIESAIDKIKQLNGVKFRWIESSVIGHPGEYDYGILSTDVEKIAPELVVNSIHEAPEGDFYKTVAYDKLVAFTIEAIKEQQKLIETLAEKVKVLESK